MKQRYSMEGDGSSDIITIGPLPPVSYRHHLPYPVPSCIINRVRRGGTTLFDIRRHSSRHIEVKIIYPLYDTHSYAKDVDYYIFSPPQLNVSPKSISRDSMLRKFQSHGRYSSPSISLEEVLDEGCVKSPLFTLERYLKALNAGRQVQSDISVIHEIQLLANTVRHHASEMQEAMTGPDADDMKLDAWFDSAREILRKFRVQVKEIERFYPTGNKITTAFCWGDEAMSIQVESTAALVYQYKNGRQDLVELARCELEYREKRSYRSVPGAMKRRDEKYMFRCAELKKWTQSLLYLHPIISKAPERMSGILAGAAAAIAMSFATLAAIFAEAFFLKNSLPWAMMIILAYVFKDRIKEGLRALFSATVPHLLADKIIYFRSPRSGKNLMKAKMLIKMKSSSNFSPTIQHLREAEGNPFFDILPEEDVVHYRRYVKVYRQEASDRLESGISEITVVLRIRLDDWLKEMDDSEDDIFIPTSDIDFSRSKGGKVYHLHLISTMSNEKREIEEAQLYRIVMNTEGIVRIEKLPFTL